MVNFYAVRVFCDMSNLELKYSGMDLVYLDSSVGIKDVEAWSLLVGYQFPLDLTF